MRRDPIRPLADTGLWVLQTVRCLAMPPVPDQPRGSYESQLRDPVLALSGLCDELLQRLAAVPLEEEPENLPNETESRFARPKSPGSPLPALARAGAAETRVPPDVRDETAGSQTENQAAWPGTPGPDHAEASPSERSRGLMDHAPSQDEPVGAAPDTDIPAPPPRPTTDGFDGLPTARQRVERAPRSRNVQQHPVGSDGERSQEKHGSETRPPARQVWPETRLTGSSAHAPASDLPAQMENGSAREAGGSDVPLPGSRLTGSTERLAAMLRSHVAQPEPVTGATEGQGWEGDNRLSSRQEDDERGTVGEPGRARPAGRAGIEEIMERIAEELETEFVRTYGRTGG